MNKERRKALYAIAKRLTFADNKNTDEIGSIKRDLESILYDEEYAMDNIPENLQGSYRYEQAEEACDNLQSAIDVLDDEDVDIDSAIKYIYDATV